MHGQENHPRVKRVVGAGKGSKGPKAQPSSVSEEMEFVRSFMTLNADERGLIGHNITSFIKDCTFRGRTCDLEK